jgi:GT2 family glycosyltransferase
MDLSIIIVSFNTELLLKGCLESLCRAIRPLGKTVLPASLDQDTGDKPSWTWGGRRITSEKERLEKEYQKKPSAEVIVVDNASTDGSCEMIRKEFPWVELICSHQNLGFAKACNLGIKESSGHYLLLLNPDTIVYPRTLEVMSRYLDKYPRVAVSTCRVELPNGEFDLPAHRGFPTPWRAFSRLFNSYHLGHLDFKRIHEIDSPMGAFYLVRWEAVDQVGLLDEDFFWYGEDLDWSYRFKQAGWKITYVPHVKILHYHGAASGVKKSSQSLSSADQQTKRMAVRESVRAMKLFYQKHYQEKYPRFITWLVLLGIRLLEGYRVKRWA